MLSYEGIFFDNDVANYIFSLEKTHLPMVNDILHCTFKYHPEENEIFDELVGREIEILLLGYACDGKNSGFLVKIPDEYMKYYINRNEENPDKLKPPHITTSLAEGAKAKDTQYLNFQLFDKPYIVKGKFGYWIKEYGQGYLSFDKYKKSQKL